MANSYVDYCGQFARVNDQLLRIIISIVRDVAHKRPGLGPGILSDVDAWQFETLNAPPGLITIDLTGYWASDDGKGILRSLLEHAEQRLRSYGDIVPATVLQSLMPPTAIRFIDTKVALILGELQKIRALV